MSQCATSSAILQTQSNKNSEAYAHHLLFMFYPLRNEEELLSENNSYIEKVNEPKYLQQ